MSRLLFSAQGKEFFEGRGSLRGINYELKQLTPKLLADLYFVSIMDIEVVQQVLKVSKR